MIALAVTQGSAGSTGPTGAQGVQGLQGFQGEKTIILNYKNQYISFNCVESPEVRIEDIVEIKLKQNLAIVDIEEMFLNICDKNSILVSGLSCNKQCLVSAKVFKIESF